MIYGTTENRDPTDEVAKLREALAVSEKARGILSKWVQELAEDAHVLRITVDRLETRLAREKGKHLAATQTLFGKWVGLFRGKSE